MTKSPYFFKSKPKIKVSYCAYLDILGFTADIIEADENESSQYLLEKLLTAMHIDGSILTDLESHDEKKLWALKVFTDNIVLGYPLIKTDGEGEFGWLMAQLSYYQTMMAVNGFFVRGGLSIGTLFIGKDIVYGKALLDAYSIESNIANTPRIVLSEDVLSLIKYHTTFYGNPKQSPQNSAILMDVDGHAFVNYLITVIPNDDEDVINSSLLLQHKKAVVENLTKHTDNPKVWSKYVWVANYHNYFCDLIKNLIGYSSDLKISSTLMKQRFNRLI